jgi:DNA-binding LytR/AlgR family response regulator
MTATALIAEDEPLLAVQLQHELASAWPDLRIVALTGDGSSAAREALARRPDVCFLDIRMPGQTGLEAAEAIAEDWPDDGTPLPLVVFVTAYDQYAVQAFERAAVDYVLKPVQPERLARTCNLLRTRLAERQAAQGTPSVAASTDLASGGLPFDALAGLLAQWSASQHSKLPGASGAAKAATAPPARLRVIQAGVGDHIQMVPIDQVLVFEAADKYVRVVTADREWLIRTALRELLPQLDPDQFWQVHRGTVVRADAIEQAIRDESGRMRLALRNCRERPVVSRLHAGRFKAM